MSISSDDVKKIAHLARLQIDEVEIPAYGNDLSNILDLFEQMQLVDTKDIAPLAHPFETSQRLRADEVTENVIDDMIRFQKIAPQVEANLYLVPQVIEQEN